MKNYQGRELHYRPSEEELVERKQSTMSTKYKDYIYEQNFFFGGYQTKYKFPNGYGASVINNNASYGLELGVLYDGVPYIRDEEELDKLLKYIKELWELETEWED